MDKNFIEVTIDDRSIRKEIKKNIKSPFEAFNEYIWNSIDAKAKNINIEFVEDKEGIKQIILTDDGVGINYYDLKEKLFGKFNVSTKVKDKNLSLPKGEHGYGRFSFFLFASSVKWETIFEDKGKHYNYSISMSSDNLTNSPLSELTETNKNVGTVITFQFKNKSLNNTCSDLLCADKKDKLKELKNNLALEFAWVIELYDINFTINKKPFDYTNIIEEKDDTISHTIDNYDFKFKFIKWKYYSKNQSSRYYLINSFNEEVFTNTTTLNYKGDEFYHSIYVRSDYLNNFEIINIRNKETYKKLMKLIDKILETKKKPYLEIFVNNKFEKLKEENILPTFNPFEEQFKRPVYEQAVKKVIAFEPRLFSNNNTYQKRILLELINRLLDESKARDDLYSILSVLIDDDNSKYLKELKEQLEKYGLSNILGMIKEVEFRLGAIKYIRNIFNNNFKDFSEKDIQLLIEENYWIFGEEYNVMLGSEEDDFNKLKKVYCDIVLKQKNQEPNNLSKRQVDLFICANTENHFERRKHLIVEIKKPAHYLKIDDYRQIEDYKNEVRKISQFKSEERNSWNYILLYREISKDHKDSLNDIIKNKFTGETVTSNDFFKIFIVRWEDLLIDCEHRMNYLKNRLEDKKKNMLRNKKEEEYKKSPMSKYIGQTNEENKNG